MTLRASWFESHLLADRAGRQARTECEGLGERVHARILREGDRLAACSPVVAQEYYKRAAAAWRAFGECGFGRWVDLGDDLLALEGGQRNAGLAFFSVPARALAATGIERLAQWAAVGRELGASSRRLAGSFLEGTAPIVDRVDGERLRAWAAQARRLYDGHEWRGELVARVFLGSAPRVLPVLAPGEIAAWADLGIALQPALRESQFFTGLPPGLDALGRAERALFFETTLAVAREQAAGAAEIYRNLPAVLKRLCLQTRGKLLEILRHAAPVAATAAAEAVPVLAALINALPRQHRRRALELAALVARAFPAGAVPLLRSLPAAYEDARHEAVAEWVRRGLEIAAGSADAGQAYFALESRTSFQVLHSSSTAATLRDEQGALRKLVHMLSRHPVSIRSTDLAGLRPPLEEFPLENEITLPLRIDRFDTHEANCRLYRFLAAQLAGRRELGTYEISLPAGASSLVEYLRAPGQPPLLEEVFLLAEGFRVAVQLARQYPGLAVEQRDLSRLILARLTAARPPSQEAVLDAVLAWLLAGAAAAETPAWMQALAAVVAPCVAPLAAPDATASDALAVARALSERLSASNRGTPEPQLEALAFERIAGETVEPYLMDPELESPAAGADAARPRSAGEEQEAPAERVEFELEARSEQMSTPAAGMSAEELQRLIEAGVDLRLKQGRGSGLEGLGLYVSDLLGKLPQEQLEELRQALDGGPRKQRSRPCRWLDQHAKGAAFYYDEWDYHIGDYRQRWCRLLEVPVESDAGEFFNRTLSDYAALIPDVRRQFQRIRPETYRLVRGLEDGEDFDLNAVVSARVDLRARRAPSPKLYTARQREERDVATLFLIDLSASTDEPVKPPAAADGEDEPPAATPARRNASRPRRIIDVTKEALVIMAEALEEIGDAYAIYGFSGHGRSNVEFYLVKAFNEPLTSTVKGRIGALSPRRSTRMGAALRHAAEKMAGISARSRHMILLSDGFPQDFDYGQDRRSNVYGLRDTGVALKEIEAAGITPFCITVDKAGHDYLRQMCDQSRYMVIDDIASLPAELPKVYQRVVAT